MAQLASYVAPARVIALSSVESLVDACAREPAVYAQMTSLVQIDTAEIKRLKMLAIKGLQNYVIHESTGRAVAKRRDGQE